MNRILPVILLGSLTYAFNNISIPVYQQFITNFASGVISQILTLIVDCTFNCFSLFLAGSMALSVAEEKGVPASKHFVIACTSLVTFLCACGLNYNHFKLIAFSAMNSVLAIVSALAATYLYLFYDEKIIKHRDELQIPLNFTYNHPFIVLLPFSAAIVTCSCIITLIIKIAAIIQPTDPFLALFRLLFKNNSITFVGIEGVTLLKNSFYFFGVNGIGILKNVFQYYLYPFVQEYTPFKNAIPVAGDIYTPYYMLFQSLGGSGGTMGLIIAILLFSKRRSSRTLAKTALLPAVFNINEILVYGLPIMFNPVLIIPFIISPLISTAITYVAVYAGMLPVPQMVISWSTPPLISGYLISHNISGISIQMLCIVISILVYRPFVQIYDELLLDSEMEEIETLTEIYKESEFTTKEVFLTHLHGTSGIVARIIAHDIDIAIKNKGITIMYQPQFDDTLKIFGVEALLRWKHSVFGNLYPPLIIKLAAETGQLIALEETIFSIVAKDIAKNPSLKYSINATPISLRDRQFVQFLIRTFSDFLENHFKIYIEITEQSELINDETMLSHLKLLKEAGFKLAIDDFSMGHTSLNYIQQNNFDLIKLDGSMTKQVLTNQKTCEIIDSLVYLSKRSGFDILAEYVQTKDQVEILQQLGCHMYQGSLCGMAVPFQFIDLYE